VLKGLKFFFLLILESKAFYAFFLSHPRFVKLKNYKKKYRSNQFIIIVNVHFLGSDVKNPIPFQKGNVIYFLDFFDKKLKYIARGPKKCKQGSDFSHSPSFYQISLFYQKFLIDQNFHFIRIYDQN